MEDEISSVPGLQRSPLYRGHVRSKGLTYEMATEHRLRVYRALRRADPEGFAALLSRRDLKDFDLRAPGRAVAALEPLLSSALAILLLLLPALSHSYAPYRAPAALLWLALCLFAALRGSCSPAAWLLGVFVTRGPWQLPAGFAWVTWCCLLDSAFLLATMGLAAIPNAAFRLATGQSVMERMLSLQPGVEVCRPTRLPAAPPAMPRPTPASGARASAAPATAPTTAGRSTGGGGRWGLVTPRRLS